MRYDPTSAVLTALAALKEGQQQFVEALGRLRSELISRMDRVDSAITISPSRCASLTAHKRPQIRLAGNLTPLAIGSPL